MKQFVYTFTSGKQHDDDFAEAREYAANHSSYQVFAHVFYGFPNPDKAMELVSYLKELFPGIKVLGSSSNGEIARGRLLMRCNEIKIDFFESTRIDTRVYDCLDVDVYECGNMMRQEIRETCECKAGEVLLATHEGLSVNRFFDALEQADDRVKIFGAAASKYPDTSDTFVFNEDTITMYGVATAIYSGVDFHLNMTYALGWKELGHPMTVTDAKGNLLNELDYEPAFNVYKRHLKIQNDDAFSKNALGFPLMLGVDGVDVARISLRCSDDGALGLGGELKNGDVVRLGYGDPDAILDAVYEAQDRERLFQPQSILMYSCQTRKTFWGDDIANELEPFEKTAPSAGFYTFGEYIRIGHHIYVHNATLIVMGMREGNAQGLPLPAQSHVVQKKMSGEISMVERLVSFVKATTLELEKANKKLSMQAITDDLTGINNRRHIEEIMDSYLQASRETGNRVCLLLMDIDFFKQVNDTYGHEVGDQVLRKVAGTILRHTGIGGACGRWGGEEFMMVLKGRTLEEAISIAEDIRTEIASTNFAPADGVTLSVGVIQTRLNEQSLDVYRRVDKALYNAKESGRNKVVAYTD